MRTLNELYIILYDSIKDEEVMSGLCKRMIYIYIAGYITRGEYNILNDNHV